ncbi:uncharacterized protein LOC116261307 [Nymphaea colorata]|nr:uncharacterized protein LOC116261307 [Nymphaea colorata]
MRLQGSGGVRMISLAMDNGHRNGNCHVISGDLSHRRLNPMPSNSSSVVSSSSSSNVNYIEHHVSKMDTLAGVAIRYGVEVSDIKRLNGLVTDLQMFAHKSLQIPLPGRHPPSPIIANGSVMQENGNSSRVPSRYAPRKLFKDLPPVELKPQEAKVSAAMSSLQGYYGLMSSAENGSSGDEGTEMTLYKTKRGHFTADEPPSPVRASEDADFCLGKHWNSMSMLNGFSAGSSDESLDIPVAEAGNNDTERSNEKPVRRRQRTDVDPAYAGSELGEDTTSGGLLGRSVKGLALRLKSASRVNLAGADADSANNHAHPFGDSLFANGFAGVRRSSSTSNLQEPFDGAASNRSASKWTLRPDLQVLTAVAIPIFDGLPKPISGKRNKAALD